MDRSALLRAAQGHLPLTHVVYHVLLSLSGAPRHGYGIIKDVEERTHGRLELGSTPRSSASVTKG